MGNRPRTFFDFPPKPICEIVDIITGVVIINKSVCGPAFSSQVTPKDYEPGLNPF